MSSKESHNIRSTNSISYFLIIGSRKIRPRPVLPRTITLLLWDRSGFVVWYKRLEAGTFELPDGAAKSYALSWDKLVMILEGIVLKSVQKRKRYMGKKVANN